MEQQIKVTLNVTKDVKNNIIAEIDKRRYAMLDNKTTDRFDLFNLALAIGVQEGKPTPLGSHESFVRTERLDENTLSYYRAIYYDKILAPDCRPIDDIVNTNAVLELIEQYVNTGFIKIKEYMQQYDEDTFMLKILANASNIYRNECVINGIVAEDGFDSYSD